MIRTAAAARASSVLVPLLAGMLVSACQEGSASGYQIPLPTEQTPRVCPGEVRTVATSFPAVVTTGTTPLAAVQFIEGRNPESVALTWSVAFTIAPSNATDLIVRDSRDTTKVLFTAQRLPQGTVTFAFAGSAASLTGSVDADTFYETLRSGSAEMAFLIPGSATPQARIALTAGTTKDWTNRTC